MSYLLGGLIGLVLVVLLGKVWDISRRMATVERKTDQLLVSQAGIVSGTDKRFAQAERARVEMRSEFLRSSAWMPEPAATIEEQGECIGQT